MSAGGRGRPEGAGGAARPRSAASRHMAAGAAAEPGPDRGARSGPGAGTPGAGPRCPGPGGVSRRRSRALQPQRRAGTPVLLPRPRGSVAERGPVLERRFSARTRGPHEPVSGGPPRGASMRLARAPKPNHRGPKPEPCRGPEAVPCLLAPNAGPGFQLPKASSCGTGGPWRFYRMLRGALRRKKVANPWHKAPLHLLARWGCPGLPVNGGTPSLTRTVTPVQSGVAQALGCQERF